MPGLRFQSFLLGRFILHEAGKLDKRVVFYGQCIAALISTIPAIILIIFFQKYIVSGLLTGAIK
jgi:ABC-type glycerol-3-phosphate transport system permease component